MTDSLDNPKAYVQTTLVEHPEPNWGLGKITAQLTAQRFPGEPVLDTRVVLSIDPFSITWSEKENMMRDLGEVIRRYQI